MASGTPLSGGHATNGSAKGTWADPYVATAESLHLPLFDDASLNVHAPATREAVVQILLAAFHVDLTGAPAPTFRDVRSSSAGYKAIGKAQADGIVAGDNDAGVLFRPTSNVNRAEAAKIVEGARGVYRQ
jgi:hypothetical protein